MFSATFLPIPLIEHNISIVWRIRENVVNSQLVTEYENPVESAKWKLELSDEKEDLKSTGKVKLTDKNLVTQDTFEKAKMKILDTLDGPDFFCYCEEKREEDADGHTQNPC